MIHNERWNKLNFLNEEEYYELLGFLSQENPVIRMITDDNKQSGAGGSQTRFYLDSNIKIHSLPRVLKDAYLLGDDPVRLSETAFIRNLRENHHFDVSSTSGRNDYITHWYKSSLEEVLTTVPEQYRRDFYRGYHWNCELVYKIRTTNLDEDNYSNETYQENSGGHIEGKRTDYYTTKYERNSRNRQEAVRIHGTICMVCGFDFEKAYGELGKHYIEVHHVKPLSSLEEETVVDPATDLICVCANCHRMLHRFKDYIISVDELINIVEENKSE